MTGSQAGRPDYQRRRRKTLRPGQWAAALLAAAPPPPSTRAQRCTCSHKPTYSRTHARARRAGPDPDSDVPGTGAGQYPGEKEVTFPPFTCLETDGEPRVERSAQGEVVIFPLKVQAPAGRAAPAPGVDSRPGLS